MIVLVTGGRDFPRTGLVGHVLDQVHALAPITLLIEGEAAGVDTYAREWGEARGVAVSKFPTTPEAWAVLGLAAGPARNAQMLEAARQASTSTGKPLTVIAFRGGGGTADMVSRAVAVGVRTLRVRGVEISSHVIEPVVSDPDE